MLYNDKMKAKYLNFTMQEFSNPPRRCPCKSFTTIFLLIYFVISQVCSLELSPLLRKCFHICKVTETHLRLELCTQLQAGLQQPVLGHESGARDSLQTFRHNVISAPTIINQGNWKHASNTQQLRRLVTHDPYLLIRPCFTHFFIQVLSK